MADRVMTAPLAIVKVSGVAIAKIKSLRINETIQRGTVSGLGELVPSELPPLSWRGTASFDFYNVEFRKSQIPKGIVRAVQTVREWIDTVLLQETGVQVDIFKKETDTVDATTGIIKAKPVLYATIKELFLDTEGMDIAEAQVSNRTQSFQYRTPILFPA